MIQKTICGLALSAFASVSLSQVIGSVTNVQGLVTVSDATTVTSVVQGTAVVNGTRFVTSSAGSATLVVNRDCTITLQPNQSLTFEPNKTCAQLTALVETLGTTQAGGPTLGQVIALAAGAALLIHLGDLSAQ